MSTIRTACMSTCLAGLTALSAGAAELMESRNAAFRLALGQMNLEGPAVTGTGDAGGEDVDGYGIQVQALQPIRGNAFGTAALDWSVYDDEFQFFQTTLGLGYRQPVIERTDWGVSLYGVLGIEYARSEGLGEYRNDAKFGGQGTGEDGDDIGGSVEGGANLTFARAWETALYAKYFNFGDGDGPGFGARLNYTINEDWTAVSSWEGIWVEDAGFNIDIATQKFTLGLARKF